MRIGDKIRFLKSKDEGIIRNFTGKDTVDIEIEDGFIIPALRKEIVVIPQEDHVRTPLSSDLTIRSGQTLPQGTVHDIYLALIPEKTIGFFGHLINRSPYDILYSFYLQSKKTIRRIFANGSLAHHAQSTLGLWNEIYEWPQLEYDVLFIGEGNLPREFPVNGSKTLISIIKTLKEQKIFELNQTGFLVPLLNGIAIPDPEKIKESMYRQVETETIKDQKSIPVPEVIDLHIEKIPGNPFRPGDPNILTYQLDYFEQILDRVINSGKKEITFIHGTGNRILREQIHKRLGKNPFVKFFEDAAREKFGFGATKVHLQ